MRNISYANSNNVTIPSLRYYLRPQSVLKLSAGKTKAKRLFELLSQGKEDNIKMDI
jgi:hypothetical protein